MEYIILAVILIGFTTQGIVIFYLFKKNNLKKIIEGQHTLNKTVNQYAEIQKKNTETLIGLLQNAFVVPPNEKPSPNEAVKENKDDIEFSENNPMEIPKDIKFEVEGGDSSIPPGYN